MQLEKLWDFQSNEQLLGFALKPTNNNKNNNTIAYSKTGKILILSSEGNLLFKDQITQKSPIWNALIFDIDNDGRDELLFGGMDGLLRVFKYNEVSKLEPFWSHKFGNSVSGILVDDINNDGIYEIISYSLDRSLRVLSPFDGSLIWGQLFEDGISDATIWKNPKDFNEIEIIACSNDGTLRIFDNENGKLLWFKKYSNKMRCISYLESIKGVFIICGGDDKKLHFIDKNTQNEIKTLKLDNYVWKCVTFPNEIKKYVAASTYSFAHFNKTSTERTEFSSKMIFIDENLDLKWELKNKNIESISPIDLNNENFILLGTTKGELLILEITQGKIMSFIKNETSLNDIKYEPRDNLVMTCHDNGAVFTFRLKY